MKIRHIFAAMTAGSIMLLSLWAQTADQAAVSPAGGSVQNAKAKQRKGPPIPQGPTPHFSDGRVDLSDKSSRSYLIYQRALEDYGLK